MSEQYTFCVAWCTMLVAMIEINWYYVIGCFWGRRRDILSFFTNTMTNQCFGLGAVHKLRHAWLTNKVAHVSRRINWRFFTSSGSQTPKNTPGSTMLGVEKGIPPFSRQNGFDTAGVPSAPPIHGKRAWSTYQLWVSQAQSMSSMCLFILCFDSL